jgi:hypothetical protein
MDNMMTMDYIDTKVQRIRECVAKIKITNPTMFFGNIENILSNSQYSTMLGYKNNANMRQYYDNWFNNIQCEFRNQMNNKDVITIINESF